MMHNNQMGQISCSECNPNGFKTAREMMPLPGHEEKKPSQSPQYLNSAWEEHPTIMHELSALNQKSSFRPQKPLSMPLLTSTPDEIKPSSNQLDNSDMCLVELLECLESSEKTDF